MTAIGETLRRERLRRNLALDEISRELKISSKFLEAIEDERVDRLPGGVFAKSFVRQYARMLGLDDEERVGEVGRALDPTPAVPTFAEQRQPPPSDIRLPRGEEWEAVADSRRSSSLPARALVVVMMRVCSGVYAWWQRTHRPATVHEDVAAPAETARAPQMQPAVQAPAALPEASPPLSVPAQPPTQNTADRPAGDRPIPANPEGTPAVRTASLGAAAAPPTSASPQESVTPVRPPAANPNAPIQVAVTADEPVWVLARADGKFSFSGTLEANQTRMVEANDTVVLRLGNAGGVSIKLNGKPVGSVGPKGQLRTVQFTSGGFQIVVPPKPSLPLDLLL